MSLVAEPSSISIKASLGGMLDEGLPIYTHWFDKTVRGDLQAFSMTWNDLDTEYATLSSDDEARVSVKFSCPPDDELSEMLDIPLSWVPQLLESGAKLIEIRSPETAVFFMAAAVVETGDVEYLLRVLDPSGFGLIASALWPTMNDETVGRSARRFLSYSGVAQANRRRERAIQKILRTRGEVAGPRHIEAVLADKALSVSQRRLTPHWHIQSDQGTGPVTVAEGAKRWGKFTADPFIDALYSDAGLKRQRSRPSYGEITGPTLTRHVPSEPKRLMNKRLELLVTSPRHSSLTDQGRFQLAERMFRTELGNFNILDFERGKSAPRELAVVRFRPFANLLPGELDLELQRWGLMSDFFQMMNQHDPTAAIAVKLADKMDFELKAALGALTEEEWRRSPEYHARRITQYVTNGLSLAQAEVVSFLVEGFSQEWIAKARGVTPAAITDTKKRALKKILATP